MATLREEKLSVFVELAKTSIKDCQTIEERYYKVL